MKSLRSAHTLATAQFVNFNVIDDWVAENDLTLNWKTSVEIVITAPRSRRTVVIPFPVVSGFERVESLKLLDVTVSNKLSFSDHVEELLTKRNETERGIAKQDYSLYVRVKLLRKH